MKYLIIVFSIFLMTNIFVSAQVDSDFPQINETDIPGGKITRTDYYDGDALWGLIDGGADVYLEYGFDKLLFQEINWNGLKFRVEIYRMNDDKGAFGIFSVSRYRCNINDTLTQHICVTPYQVQATVGKFYISVANEKGNKEAQQLTLDLFSKYLASTKETPFVLPALFKNITFEPYKSQMKFVKGKLGLQNGFAAWIELFDDYSNFEIYLIPVELENGYAYIAQIRFGTENEKQKFVTQIEQKKKSDVSKKIITLTRDEIIFIESNLSGNDLSKFTDLINNK